MLDTLWSLTRAIDELSPLEMLIMLGFMFSVAAVWSAAPPKVEMSPWIVDLPVLPVSFAATFVSL
jgi:hypothetical protein